MYKKQANKNTGEPKVIELNLSATVAVIIAIIVLIVTVTSVKVITTIIVADENKKLNNDTQAANERVTYVNSTLKDESGNIVNETDADGNIIKVPVPKGYSASKIEGETTASKGFVIYEGDVNWKNILVSSKSSQSNVAIDEPAFDDDLVVINEKLDGVNRLYMGTWQFNGQFKTLTENEIISLLNYAKSKGITRYDTALAYGKTEEYISKSNCRDDIILTKIPAKTKPKQDEICNINDYYTKEYIYECLTKSLKNLDRNFVDILLLHNWHDSWNQNPEVIEWLLELKEKQLVKRIGISLPNNYQKRLNDNVLYDIDVIEAPYNIENKWIEKDIEYYKKHNIEIILRSLFLQGKMLGEANNYEEYIQNAKKFNTSLVIGMTTIDQIEKNINCVRSDENGTKEKRNKYKL